MFDNAKQWIANQIAPYLPEATLPQVLHGFSGAGADQNPWVNYTQEAYERLAITSPLVKPNIDQIGKSFADSVFKVQEPNADNPEDYNDIINHKFERLINVQPFTDMGGAFAKWYQAQWYWLRGEAYWMLINDGFGALKYMLPIPAFMMKPIPWKQSHGGEPRLISYYAYAPRDPYHPQRLNCENVCYHRIPNPFSPIRGLSPLSSYLLTLKTAVEAEQFDLDDYQHGLTLAKIISLRPELSNRDYQKAVSDWMQFAEERARFRILRGGDVDVKDLVNRRGEDGQNIHDRAKRYADRNWGIPEALRDLNATEASAKVAERTYESGTVMPNLKVWAQDFTSQILWRYWDESLRCVPESTVPKNIEEAAADREAKRQSRTYDEFRSLDGLEPHPDPEVGNAPATRAGEIYQEKIKLQAIQLAQEPAQAGTIVHQDLLGDEMQKSVRQVLVDLGYSRNGHS